MRVFELNTFCGAGSTGRIAARIARLVRRDGGECLIGYGAGSPAPDTADIAYRIGEPLERKLHGAIRKLADGEGLGSALATRALIKRMESFKPDVVQLHNIHGCYLNHRLLFDWLKKSGVPVVWTLHDCWPFTGHCAYFDYIGCEKWRAGCEKCPQLQSYPVCCGLDGSRRNYLRKRELFTSLDSLTLVTPCEWMKDVLSRSFMRSIPVRVIPNGVDASVFHPVKSDLRERYGIGGAKLLLAVASDWDERKGLRYLIEAAERMGEGFRFVALGLDEAQIKALPKSVLGLGRTNGQTELAQWYTAADCLVNPTMEDNMPMVNIEALSCGTPVIAFNTGGCPEAVGAGCGAIVPKGDVPALCHAIRSLCEIPKPVQKCLARAAKFDADVTFEGYINLYKELCV